MAVNYYKSICGSRTFPFTIDDFKELYPLLVFYVSKHIVNIHVLVQRWSSVGNVAVGFQEKTYDGPMLDINNGNITDGFQHYADGKPSVHIIGCNDSTNNLLSSYLISPDMA